MVSTLRLAEVLVPPHVGGWPKLSSEIRIADLTLLRAAKQADSDRLRCSSVFIPLLPLH